MSLRTARTVMLLALAIPLAVGCSDLGSDVVRPQEVRLAIVPMDSLGVIMIGDAGPISMTFDTLATSSAYPPPRSPKEG